MGASRVKVAEKGSVPVIAALAFFLEVVALSLDVISDAGFDSGFCAAVRVRGTNWTVFGDWNHVWEACGVAIDGCRRGEDNVGDIVRGHGGEEVDCAVNVCAVVFKRDFGGFADCLLGDLKSAWGGAS